MSERVICPHCKHEYGSEDDEALSSTYSNGNFTCIFGCGKEFRAPQVKSNVSKATEGKQPSSQKLKVKYFSIQNIAIAIGLIFIVIAILLGKKVNAIGFGVGDVVFIGICIIIFGSLSNIIGRGKQKQTEDDHENLKNKRMEEETAITAKSKNVKQITYTAKSYSTAVLLWLFLGGFGAHKFYLEKLPLGFGYIVLLTFSIAFQPFFILLVIFWIIDIFTLRDQVNAFNKELESK